MLTQKVPYLRSQRNFPNDDTKTLSLEMDRTYIDIADKMNVRTIGIYAKGNQTVTGEQWYIQGSAQKQQTIREVYTFTTFAAIAHGIILTDIDQFTRMYGQFTDGTKWYGLIAGNIGTPIAGQVVFDITSTNIEFASGAGAPSITKGNIVLEWLAVF